jgi:hypothetical protein
MVGRHDGSMGLIEPLALGASVPRVFQPKDPCGMAQLLVALPKIENRRLHHPGNDARTRVDFRGRRTVLSGRFSLWRDERSHAIAHRRFAAGTFEPPGLGRSPGTHVLSAMGAPHGALMHRQKGASPRPISQKQDKMGE